MEISHKRCNSVYCVRKIAGYTAKFLYSNIKTKLLVSISFLPGILIYNVWKRKSDFIEK